MGIKEDEEDGEAKNLLVFNRIIKSPSAKAFVENRKELFFNLFYEGGRRAKYAVDLCKRMTVNNNHIVACLFPPETGRYPQKLKPEEHMCYTCSTREL
ncbi:hypothetical protein QE152_g38168 [Popillia japonica]|uniref:SCP domain-containing protein n=1 Tax=Popillia japonica TaxID=7064 RepID=A0AAW1I8B2_POPJA